MDCIFSNIAVGIPLVFSNYIVVSGTHLRSEDFTFAACAYALA
jgi:hypothetical protein